MCSQVTIVGSADAWARQCAMAAANALQAIEHLGERRRHAVSLERAVLAVDTFEVGAFRRGRPFHAAMIASQAALR